MVMNPHKIVIRLCSSPLFCRAFKSVNELITGKFRHLWMQNLSAATGLGFISHFDSIWTKWDQFKYDGHPKRNGTKNLELY